MNAWACVVIVTLYCLLIFQLSYETILKIGTKKLNVQRIEDYTFESELNRARDECSYMSLSNATFNRNKTLQMIKEKINKERLKEFYEQKEKEKQSAIEYYENVKKQSMRRVFENGNHKWDFNFTPPRAMPPISPPRPPPPPLPPPPLQQPPPPPPPVQQPRSFIHRNVFKRSAGSGGRRRKTSNSFSEISFTDHNNCSSRCLFARMEMVNPMGFPDESLITKLIDDKITNRKVRLSKMKKVASCFKKMEEVALDDSCIFATKLFECLDLGEPYSWSSNK